MSNFKAIEQVGFTEEDAIYKLTGNSERFLKFDNVYTKWMLELYDLVKHIAGERQNHGIKISEDVVVPNRYKFYGLAETAANQLMYFFIKDMLSESEGNKDLDTLCYHLMNSHDENYTESESVQLNRYLANLVIYNHNPIVQAQFYDFYIDFWTGFEACINLVCREYEDRIQEKINESQFKKMKMYLDKLCDKNEDIEKDKVLIAFETDRESYIKSFGGYVDFPSKYNYLFKEVIKEHYKRDWKKDNETLLFCGALRNTMHNNGTHLKADRKIVIDGISFDLQKMQKMYWDSFGEVFILARELFDIYVAIVDGVDESYQG